MKARALDVEIIAEQFELPFERHLLLRAAAERSPQQLAELPDHVHRRLVIVAPHQRGDGVERIEEEVRIELHAQRLEPRLGHAGLELGRAQPQVRGPKLPLAIAAIELDRPRAPHNAEVGDEVDHQEQVEQAPELRPQGRMLRVAEGPVIG